MRSAPTALMDRDLLDCHVGVPTAPENIGAEQVMAAACLGSNRQQRVVVTLTPNHHHRWCASRHLAPLRTLYHALSHARPHMRGGVDSAVVNKSSRRGKWALLRGNVAVSCSLTWATRLKVAHYYSHMCRTIGHAM